MYRRILKYYGLSLSDWMLLLNTFILLGFVRMVILILPFRYLSSLLGKHMQESDDIDDSGISVAKRISWATQLMSRYTPWESKCLVQAIVAKILLRQRGLENTLYLGVAKDQKKEMIAHAWLRSGKVAVTGGFGHKEFAIVAKFSDFSEEKV